MTRCPRCRRERVFDDDGVLRPHLRLSSAVRPGELVPCVPVVRKRRSGGAMTPMDGGAS